MNDPLDPFGDEQLFVPPDGRCVPRDEESTP